MEENIRIVYKEKGETPLDCINTLKKSDKKLTDLPMTYAGRLDPLAEGVLVILIGDMCHKKDEYLNLSKEYEVDVLFGFSTDTYDVMGKVKGIVASSDKLFERSSDLLAEFLGKLGQTIPNSSSDFAPQIKNILPNFIGKIKQSYPPYSSRTVNGKPLYEWAREDRLGEIDIPEHDVFVENIEIINEDFIFGEKLLEKIKSDIEKVKGDFRQKEIIALWEDILKDKKEEKYKIIRLKISCGSGVYVRGIANDLGKELGVPALALNIVRTKVGEYSIFEK
jgi:tRNA pseudouridine55 synthase